ncbi:ribonuclease VapC [Candidatus Woesearchaeota archaeon]|nr:MAG: ribonuclease VapC [Candidatus Woesearchaeota archaeon]
MKQIIPDTNFLIECTKNRIDLLDELTRILDFKFEVKIIDKTIEELDKIIQKGGKQGKTAKLTKTIIKAKKLKTIKTGKGYADNILLQKANKNTIIATQDKELKKRIRKKGMPVIIIRQKKYFKIE